MESTKPTRKVKKIPRTTGIRGIGSCGHEYSQRFVVPDFIHGVDRSVVGIEQYEAWKTTISGRLSQGPCADCTAASGLAVIRETVKAIANWAGRPPLPELEGSVRLVFFAEQVRFDYLMRHLANEISNSIARVGEQTSANALLLDALRNRWPLEDWLIQGQEEGSKAGREVLNFLTVQQEDDHGLSYFRQACRTPQDALLGWISVRRSWPNEPWGLFLAERRPKAWIARQKSRRGLGPELPGGEWEKAALADFIVFSVGSWSTPEEAWNAWRGLSDTEESGVPLMGAVNGTGRGGLKDHLSSVAVMRALSESRAPSTLSDWIYHMRNAGIPLA